MHNYFFIKECTDKTITDEYLYVNNLGYTKGISNGTNVFRKDGRLDYQILYIDKGYAHFLIDDEFKKVDAGNIVILPPGQVNHYIFPEDDFTDYYWIHFTGYGVASLLKELRLESNIYKTGEFHKFKDIFASMMSFGASKSFFLSSYFSSCIHMILTETAKKIYYQKNLFNKVLLKMQNSTINTINNAELAQICEMSEYHFIRAFKKNTGKTPHQYMVKLTVDKAIDLFSTTTMSISEVAFSLGFADPLYFSRLFKKNTGLSPKNYIKEHLQHLQL